MNSDANPTLIVVDDDPEDQLLVRTAVRRAGLPLMVESLRNGDELMRFMAGQPKSRDAQKPTLLILLDLNMPGMDGRACLRELKSDPAWSAIPKKKKKKKKR